VPRILKPEKEQKSVEICKELLKRYREVGDQFLLNIVTGDESWIHHFDPEKKTTEHAIQPQFISSPQKFKRVPSAGKILCLFFWTHKEFT
jgi:histone-lysine N-methyltransferase SETMAR